VNILVTGGAGFVGTHLTPLLVADGHRVTLLDNLSPQIHPEQIFPPALRERATCIRADVRDIATLRDVVGEAEAIVHLAAETGTGQSMYDIHRYSDVNVLGTAALLDVLMNRPNRVERFVLASSRAVYGEGQYLCPRCGTVYPMTRSAEQLASHAWDLSCPLCHGAILPTPTHEDARLQPQSVYASGKQTQEQLVAIACKALGIETVILRYQNVYGPGQALGNPYTGVICVFFGLLMQGKPILLFEDGRPSRDFVFIDDVAAATRAAVRLRVAAPTTINVGTGVRTTIREVAETVGRALGREVVMEVTGKYRLGDIRHCYSDITRLTEQLGYIPCVSFSEGIARFVAWARDQAGIVGESASGFERAQAELLSRNLFR
jgi:dTDP-L-rhamnose 4-epimerase